MKVRGKVAVGLAIALVVAFPITRSLADSETSTVASLQIQPATALVDRAIPTNLKPALSDVKSDRPKPYKDRCHTQQDLEKSASACEYGNLKSKTTIVLFGDSHALSWFPALERLAIAKDWKLLSLTMSSCWPADIPAWNSTTNKLMPNCAFWRTDSLNDIAKLKPSMVFVTGTRGFTTIDKSNRVLQGDERTAAWEVGMEKTLLKLKKASPQVIFISDTPISKYDAPVCLAEHKESISNCATPFNKSVSTSWLSEEAKVAHTENVTWVNPTAWICSTDPCSPLSGRYEIFVDKGHLTASFAWTLERPLWKQLTTNN